MTQAIDLDAYFHRIGYAGARVPTPQVLQEIHRRHADAIAFENLDPFLRRPVLLDLPSLEQKIVRDGRGGYCFEQNLLLSHVLRTVGFRVRGLAARVLWNAPSDDVVTPRTHMLLRVDIGELAYIVDAGFGGQTLTGPLRLETHTEQSTPHERFRIMPAGEDFLLQSKLGKAWGTLYRFDLHEQFQPDYEIASWYLSNHPHSRFVTQLIVARAPPGCRYALLNNRLVVHPLNGPTERRDLAGVSELRTVLVRDFGLKLPDAPELDSALGRLFAGSAGMAPIAAREIDHVVLRVRDVKGAQKFYCEVLGCRVEKIQPSVGLVQLRAGRSLIDLIEAPGGAAASGTPPARVTPNMDHVCLRLEPFDAAAIADHLMAHGVAPGALERRYGAEGEGPSIYIEDPEGNTIELKGPPGG